jgi:hypothetical protein
LTKKPYKEPEGEEYVGQISMINLQQKFFVQFDYNFWMHKAHALLYFLESPDRIENLKFPGDIYQSDVIAQSLKMELHMMTFHSSETLFRMIFAIVKMPDLPWIWISRAYHKYIHDLIKKVKEFRLESLSPSPNKWIRDNLYPSILDTKHPQYEKTVKSAEFVIQYLERLAFEFIQHREYNSYKHGLHAFPGTERLQAVGDQTGKLYFDYQNDTMEYLEFENLPEYVRVFVTSKGYSTKRDYEIIRMNSAILNNIFRRRGLDVSKSLSKGTTLMPNFKGKYGYYYMDDWSLDEIFSENDIGLRRTRY